MSELTIPIAREFHFDYDNPNWSSTREYNSMFFRAITNMYNDRLKAGQVVFLNEVLQSLGIHRIPEGQLEGWEGKDAHIAIDFEENLSDGSWEVRIATDGEVWKKI